MVYLFTQICTDIDNYGKIIQIISKQVEIKLLWVNLYYLIKSALNSLVLVILEL